MCLPGLCQRWQGKGTASTVELAAQMITTLAGRVPHRRVHVVADAAYHGTSLRDLPATVTWTTRLPRNAVLYQRAPAPTGKRGRPRLKGDRIGTPAQAAVTCGWRTVSVARYGRVDTVSIATLDCLWYGVFGPPTGTDGPVRDRSGKPMLALISTDLISPLPITPAELHEDPSRLQDPDHHQQPAAGRLPSPRRAHLSATGQSGWRSLHRGTLDRNSVVRQSSADLTQFSHPQR